MPPDGLVSTRTNHTVAIVVQGVPHPSEGASAVLFYHYAKAVADAGYRVMTIAIGPEGSATARQLSHYEDAINSTSHMVHKAPVRDNVVRSSRFGLAPTSGPTLKENSGAGLGSAGLAGAWRRLDGSAGQDRLWSRCPQAQTH